MPYDSNHNGIRSKCDTSPAAAALPEPMVFVVDDDEAVRKAIFLLLKSVGLNAETYDSAHTFLNTFDPQRSGCLVLDVRMPGMSGLELQTQLAGRGITIPVILLTGHADVPMAIQAFKAGALDLIEKPFDNQHFLSRIRSALSSQSHACADGNSELSHSKELAHLTLASIGDGVISTNASGRVEYLNPVAEYLTGWENGEARSVPFHEVFCLLDERTRESISDSLALFLDDDGSHQTPAVVLVRRDGREFPIDMSVAPIRDAAGNSVGAVIIFHDATQTRQLSYHATHDPLTGLINRREFEQRLERLLETDRDGQSVHALCFLDLDRFKVVNDVAGHAAGDQLLRQLSVLLHRKMRKRDTLARLGGDEFAVILEDCPLEQAERIANNLCRTLQDFRFTWEDKVFSVGVSIGVTPVSSRNSSLTELLQAADSACYTAKGLGRNRVHVHKEDQDRLGSSQSGNGWIAAVSHALQEERFRLFQQPVLPAFGQDHQLRYEVLLRMEGSNAEMIPASCFLPVVERANLGAALDRWVIEQTLIWLTRHPEHVSRLHTCSINLSRHTLADQGFLEFVTDHLSRTRVPPERLCFELAETTVIGDLSETIKLLEALKSTGCRIAVDDFASSPSGFIYLRHLPIDVLKIDGFLVKGAVSDPVNYALVKSITEIAHTMGIVTVAKGVESAAILEALSDLEVDYLQGFHIAEPAPLGTQAELDPTSSDADDAATFYNAT